MPTIKKQGICSNCCKFGGVVKGFCQACYYRNWYHGGKAKEKKAVNCIECGDVVRFSNLCNKCYQRKRLSIKECINCKAVFRRGSASHYCKQCKVDLNMTNKRTKLKPMGHLSSDDRSLIKRLLVKFRIGWFNELDAYRSVDVYFKIFEVDSKLDTLAEMDQVRVMLSRLEKLINNEKVSS